MLGSEIAAKLRVFTDPIKRDRAVLDALDWHVDWPLVDVRFVHAEIPITVRVTSDVFALGTCEDAMRVPVGADTAQRIADAFGHSLITPGISDAIRGSAKHKLDPIPMDPSVDHGHAMMGVDYMVRHNELIHEQLIASDARHGDLVAGHKKDIVLSNRALEKPGHVVIYGWHHRNGRPIQPESAVHEITYRDYSHGLRLMHNLIIVGIDTVPFAEAVRDPRISRAFSSAGSLRHLRYATV